MKNIFLILCLIFPVFVGAQSQRSNFTEYQAGVNRLSASCKAKGEQNFSGFCISKNYEERTQRSITVGLMLASFGEFYKVCEHADFLTLNALLARAEKIDDAKVFFEEMKPQKEALQNYANHFDYCRTKDENNAQVLKKIQWFEFMVNKYGADVQVNDVRDNTPPAILKLTSSKQVERIVDCVLAQYTGAEFMATGLRANDGGIVVQLIAPVMKPLAVVSNRPGGSFTEFLNIKNPKNSIPQPETFQAAITNCQ